ncbi:4165_t:CDS:2, partial [Paraglomus brasilianum]
MPKSKRSWTAKEDNELRTCVRNLGPRWVKISSILDERSAKECAERWNNCLRPGINATSFSLTERQMIKEFYRIYGPQWSRIAANLPRRTSQMVKNCWYSMRRSEAIRIRQSSEAEA